MSEHTRRRFLGAAAAAAALTTGSGSATANQSDDGDADVYGEYGAVNKDIGTTGPMHGDVWIPEARTDEAEITVTGYAYDDEPSQVECSLAIGGIDVSVVKSVDDARALANQLLEAAAFAEDPAKDVEEGADE